MATLAEYKIGSDIIHTFDLKDQDGDAIAISGLDGYGVAVYKPDGTLLGKWGINLTGFTADTDIFNSSGTSQCVLRLASGTYGTLVGNVKAELYIRYDHDNFPDFFRDLWSEKNDIFTLRR